MDVVPLKDGTPRPQGNLPTTKVLRPARFFPRAPLSRPYPSATRAARALGVILPHVWVVVVRLAAEPALPVHNNMSELQLRRPVVGRKNWLFSGSEGGARSAAILFSITGSCRPQGIDTWAYLHDVLGRINDHPVNRIAELTPANWAGV